MSNLCIIPARGGSKRIPRKNIKDFLGKPIIAYSIELALESGLFDEVMVSTDDLEIAEIAQKYGAKVPFMRSAESSNDYAGTIDVILEVLNGYTKSGVEYSCVCCIYPTAPLIQIKHLKSAFEILLNKSLVTVFPVTAFSFPILRALKLDEFNRVSMYWPDNLNKRSQDLPLAYHDAGQFYWMQVSEIQQNKKIYTEHSGAIVLDQMEAQDIDNLSDWKLAEVKYKLIER